MSLVPFTKSQFVFSNTSKNLLASSGSTLISASKIAIASYLDLLIASHTALALPLPVCSKTKISKLLFSSLIVFATSRVLSFEGPQTIIISYLLENLGILLTNSLKFPDSFFAGTIIDFV